MIAYIPSSYLFPLAKKRCTQALHFHSTYHASAVRHNSWLPQFPTLAPWLPTVCHTICSLAANSFPHLLLGCQPLHTGASPYQAPS